MFDDSGEAWKHDASKDVTHIGDRWELHECEGEDGCVVIACMHPGEDRPAKDIHVPRHLLPDLIRALTEYERDNPQG